ncbi:MAG: hypothetical protein PHG12_11125, partial [Sphaerochaeta sp.]|nr:hypothetical protein [Sphaerochaeta sp.]
MQKIVHVSTETYKWMLYLKIQQSEDNNIVHITMLSVRKKNPAEAGRRKNIVVLIHRTHHDGHVHGRCCRYLQVILQGRLL